MVVYFLDGGRLTCNTINISGGVLIADNYRVFRLDEIEKIEPIE